MARLLLVRHGISEFNTVRRFAGSSDVDLTEDGCRQVERLRDRLATEKIDAVYASDLKRAVRTAEIIAEKHGKDIVICPELREIDYGEVEGLTFEQIGQHYPDIAGQIRNFSLELRFPGGECFGDFCGRTCKFMERVEKHGETETILVAAHGGPLRTLVCHLLGIGQEHWRQIRIDNASLTIISTYPRGAIISLLNDTSHLKS